MKRKTEDEKKLTGTERGDRSPISRMGVVVGLETVPEPQPFVHPDAHEIYYEIARHVFKSKMMMSIDSLLISDAAMQFYLLSQSLKEMIDEEKGMVQVYSTGAAAVTPEFTAYQRLSEACRKYSRILGLDVRSRESIMAFVAMKKTKKADPLKELMARKRANAK